MHPAGSVLPRPRKKIGKYVVTGRIGRGGMGMVYRGFDELLEREVAIKTLNAEGSLDQESRKRFYIEARAAARLQHPNIVTVFELGEDRGLPFIAMELLPGADLEALVRSGEELLLQERLDVVVQVCRGLSYAHEFKIVHRDIKPSNIRLLEDGTAKIMDFGIAKLAGTNVTKSGMMIGTMHYMSPEQVRGHPLDGRSDLFSLGVILYELVAGKRPFTGPSATEVLTRIVREPAPPLEVDLGVSGPELQRIIDRALAKAPEDRYPSAAAMAEDLATVATGVPRCAPAANPGETRDAVSLARRLQKEGRLEESVAHLDRAVARDPLSLEARRALRSARREMQRRQRAPEAPEADDFPELDGATTPAAGASTRVSATVRNDQATMVSPGPTVAIARGGTASGPTVVSSAPRREAAAAAAPVDHGGRGLLLVGAAAAALAIAAGVVLWLRSTDAQPATPPATAAVTLPPAPAPTVAAAVPAPAASTAPVAPAVPPGDELPAGPQGRVSVVSGYPVEVFWKGRAIGRKSTSVQGTVPVGRQTLTLSAPAVFLRSSVAVDVRAGGTATVSTPPLGTLNVRANPDSCQVFVDGTFVDYPPILGHQAAVGRHTVGFRWPDGSRREEQVEVEAGQPAYVSGRKD